MTQIKLKLSLTTVNSIERGDYLKAENVRVKSGSVRSIINDRATPSELIKMQIRSQTRAVYNEASQN